MQLYELNKMNSLLISHNYSFFLAQAQFLVCDVVNELEHFLLHQ